MAVVVPDGWFREPRPQPACNLLNETSTWDREIDASLASPLLSVLDERGSPGGGEEVQYRSNVTSRMVIVASDS